MSYSLMYLMKINSSEDLIKFIMEKVHYNKSTKKFDIIEQKTESGFYPKLAERFILEKGYKLHDRLEVSDVCELANEYFYTVNEKLNLNKFNEYFNNLIKKVPSIQSEFEAADFEPMIVGYNFKVHKSSRIIKLYKDWGRWR